ncbi:hypothetical protein [Bosea sp. (in: a-proteobacteria)]
MTTTELTATKSEFARRCNVSPGRVSQWIASGQIGPDAIAGEGRSATIKVDRALAQLRRRLDVNQRFGNGLTTRLDAGPAQPQEAQPLSFDQPAPIVAPAPEIPRIDPTEELIRLAKLREIEFRNRRAAQDEAERQGRYVLAADARKSNVQIAGEMLSIFEGALTDLASALAAKFELSQRDVLHLMRVEFTQVRARAAETMRRKGEAAPATIPDPELVEDAE